MSKRKTSKKKSRDSRFPQEERARGEFGSRQKRGNQESTGKMPSRAAIRETIESIVIAFILAFLFRTFEAEAFVIPTGSMAPTLMGRHKDVYCPVCDYRYPVSASSEVDNSTGRLNGNVVVEGTCPMCRYKLDMPRGDLKYDSFSGDRILVDKFIYQFSDPERWDVTVFKCPGKSKTNYIKRLVGLPNESLKISHGDVFTRPYPYKKSEHGEEKDGEGFVIEKKPPDKVLAMLQPVFDNDFTPKIIEHGWPPRWQAKPLVGDSPAGVWESEDFSSFRTTGEASDERWLQYEHRVSDPWQNKDRNKRLVRNDPVPRLISDSCAYNTTLTELADGRLVGRDPDAFGLHWVGDLALCCTIEVESGSGEAILELVEGGWRMQCRIDVATGVATLRIICADGTLLEGFQPTAKTDIRSGTKHKILFANVDDQLLLWVDKPGGRGLPRRLVEFDSSTIYPRQGYPKPTQTDLAPVGIGSNRARLRVSHLKVLRDIYYIADNQGMTSDFKQGPYFQLDSQPQLLLESSQYWDMFDDDNMKEVTFNTGKDRFVMLGDNSARSEDCRLWDRGKVWSERENYVSRELLTGKAIFIYWPHSWDRVSKKVPIPFPFFPNFADMEFVH